MSRPPKSFRKKVPKQARAKELTDALVTAATRVFTKADFIKVTTNRIAELAGVSIGSLYQYFPNKDALVGVIIEKRVQRQLDAIESLLDASVAKPCEQVIREIIGMIAQDSLANRTLMRTLYERGVFLEMTPSVLKAREKACIAIEEFLRENHAHLLTEQKDLSLSIFCVINGVLGALFAAVLSPRETDADALVNELAAMAANHLIKASSQ